ncbi:hypothetical protein H5410_061477 [Solanum commersonii]|uniref:Uncharacterized protein n=1 Tax=Solanum commersonii TaxID=4109 RepID=A0A9J5W8R1_SOLCO|nr:hypothetical protein H5410_061477 [Solanum commersonii]
MRKFKSSIVFHLIFSLGSIFILSFFGVEGYGIDIDDWILRGLMYIHTLIWTYDSSAPTSRNATIYCGAEIMSLEWECKSDRLLLIGTADGGIKAWNVDAKRVVCDLSCTEAFPSVLDLKCSPVEPIFVSAAASRW